MASVSSLSRIWRHVPLQRLAQGSSLTIRSQWQSQRPPPTHVILEPSWRDDGHVDFQQIFTGNNNSNEQQQQQQQHVEMIVNQEQDVATSLGRVASHISIELRFASEEPSTSHPEQQKHAQAGSFFDSLPQSPPKPIDRIILDDGTIAPVERFPQNSEGTNCRVDYHDGIAHIRDNRKDGETASPDHKPPGIYLVIQVPERVNLVCDLPQGSITITGKVEGDVQLRTADGDIRVKKLRGHAIELRNDAPGNLIIASHLLEAQTLSIQTKGRFRAKQIHGHSVRVVVDRRPNHDDHPPAAATTTNLPERLSDDVDDAGSLVDVSALFVSGKGGAKVTVHGGGTPWPRRAIHIQSQHGPVQVTAERVTRPVNVNPMTEQRYPIVELGGINGSLELAIADTVAGTIVDREWSSCLVHVDSLSQDSVSLVTADRGNIAVTLDRKTESDLRIVSLPDADCLTETGALLAEEDDANLLVDVLRHLPLSRSGTRPQDKDEKSISIQTDAFTLRRETSFVSKHIAYVDGWVENKSDEPDSRFERKVRGDHGGGGKIRLEGAKDQALHGFSDDREGTNNTGNDDGYQRPLLAVAGTSRVTVETVSWLGAIARRYGLEESGRELGRTASRKGRPLVPSE